MMVDDNVSSKWSEKKMEGEDGIRTMECLRGRLLAERMSSKVANEETEQLGKKLIELENKLKTEIKSRNRAEKRLKFLLQKLESLNISYVSDESDNSSFMEKSEISSASSTASSCSKNPQDCKSAQTSNFTKCGIEEPVKKIESPVASQTSSNTTVSSGESHNCPALEDNLGSSDVVISENSNERRSNQDEDDLKKNDNRLKSPNGVQEAKGGNDSNHDDLGDNSLALVVVDPPAKEQATDPPISNASVKDALNALRYARESIQSKMERRHMIRVGSA